MPRIRTIKPEFWQDEKLARMPDTTRFIFLALISMADDCGRVLDNVKLIEAFVWPYSDADEFAAHSRVVSDALVCLAETGRVQRGETASGLRVLQITNWSLHQKVDRPNLGAALPQLVGTPTVAALSPDSSNRSTNDSPNASRPDLRPTTSDQRPTSSEQPREERLRERCLRLAAAANQGITKRYGEQTTPIRASSATSYDTAEALEQAGVPDEFAARLVFERAQALTLDRPPRSLGYFRALVIEAWEAECAHRQAATIGAPQVTAAGRIVGKIDPYTSTAIEEARKGNPDWIAICEEMGVDYTAEVA